MSDAQTFQGRIGRTYRDSEPWWPEPVRPPEGAPNVVAIMLDDVGFADLGCYGSEIKTPHMDRLAAEGLAYTNFHVTAMCSPTRACLLSGRNAHSVGVGIIAEWSSGFPGYQGRITRRAALLPEILRDHGYGTYASGKWHLTPLSDYGAAGPHHDWPLGRGFSRWYGFQGALMDQWHPELYEDNHPVHFTAPEDYHLSTDLVNHAIDHVRDHVNAAPDRPFFEYLSFAACHWPHQVPEDVVARYRGLYDVGWDAIREQRFARQQELGVIPPKTQLAPRNPGVPAWDELAPEARAVAARLQETYAAFLEHTDHEIGRFLDHLAAIGKLDDTIVVLMSDNGGSAEGGVTGAYSMRKHYAYEPEPPAMGAPQLDRIGGRRSYPHYPWGWAQVSNTPLKWYKKDTHGGGVRAPLIMRCPKHIRDAGAKRGQFHHVVDVMPTLLEMIGIEAPAEREGLEQIPIQGTSMTYSFEDPEAPSTRHVQYFELLGDRAIWQDGWKAVTRHDKHADFDKDVWELYHLDRDFSECRDLAASEPERLQKLVDLWWKEAEAYDVLPLDDRDVERAHIRLREVARKRYDYLSAPSRVDRMNVPEITDRSWRAIADLEVTSHETEGAIFTWGSRFGGMSLHVQNGLLTFEYVYAEFASHVLRALMPRGRNLIIVDFTRTGERAARARLSIGPHEVAAIDITRCWTTYGPTAGLSIGRAEVPVCETYEPPFAFGGTLHRLSFELEDDFGGAGGDHFNHVLIEE